MADAEGYEWVEYRDFSGGLNLQDSPSEIGANQIRQGLNAMLDKKGALRKRDGFIKDVGSDFPDPAINPDGKPHFCWPDPALMTPDIIKIDPTGTVGTTFTLHTASGHYTKMIHDDTDNLTFVLHSGVNLNTTTGAIVSMIDHSLDSTDANYIISLNKSTVANWPTEFNQALSGYTYDIAYNPVTHELGIAMGGLSLTTGAPPVTTFYGPGVLTINTETMTAAMRRAPDTFQKGLNPFTKFVRYMNGRWWTWTLTHETVIAGNTYTLWQLGYFDSTTWAFTFCFQYGWSPLTTTPRPDSGLFDPSICYPIAPRSWPTFSGDTPIPGGPTSYLGDSTLGLENVATFEVIPDNGGMIIMGTQTTAWSVEFGMEPFVYRISIPLLDVELDESTRLLGTLTEKITATNHAGIYYIPAGYSVLDFTNYNNYALTNTNGGGLSYVRYAQDIYGANARYGFVSADLGSIGISPLTMSNGSAEGAGSIFSCGNSLSLTVSYDNVGSGHDASAFTVTWTAALYKLVPGLVEVIGVHSTPPLVRAADSDRPVTTLGHWTTPVNIPLWCAQKCSPAGAAFQIQRATYCSDYNCFILSLYDAVGLEGGVWYYQHQQTPEIRTFATSISGISSEATTVSQGYTRDILRVRNDVFLIGSDAGGGGYCLSDYILMGDQYWSAFYANYTGDAVHTGSETINVVFDSTTGMYGFCSGGFSSGDQIWFYDFTGQPMVCDTHTGLWEQIDPSRYTNGLGEHVIGIENVFRYYNPTQNYTIVAAITEGRIWFYYEDGQQYKSVDFETFNGSSYALWNFPGFDKTKPVQFCCYRDTLFACNGSAWVYFTPTTGAPICSPVVLNPGVDPTTSGPYVTDLVPDFMEINNDKLFVKDPRYPDELFFSIEYAWNTSPGVDMSFRLLDNFFIPERNSCQGGIVGFISSTLLDSIVTGRNRDMWYLTGVDVLDYQDQKLSALQGFISPRGFCETEDNTLISVGIDQISETAFNYVPIPIGDNITPRIVGVDMSDCCAVYDMLNKCVRIGYKGGELIWNVARKLADGQPLRAWTESTQRFTCACRYTALADANKIIFGRRDEPYVYRMNTGTTDDGADIRYIIETRTDDLGEFTTDKKLRNVKVETNGQKFQMFNLTTILNNGEQQQTYQGKVRLGNLWGQLIFGKETWSGGAIRTGNVSLSQDMIASNEFSIKIDDTSSNSLTIYKIGVEVSAHLRRIGNDA